MTEASDTVGQPLRSEEGSESAVDRVTAEVRRAVLSGALPPGRTFSTAELSAQLGVSHIPVREALRRLDAQGLIVLRPGRKAMVSPLDRDQLRAIFRLRQQIEPDLAAWSVSMLRAGDLERANTLLTAYIHGSGDTDELWDSHHELHLALLRPAASEWDLRILAQLWHASDRYTRVVFDPYAVGSRDREAREAAHRALLASARSGSPAEIRRAVSEHLSDNEVACLEGIAALRGSPKLRSALLSPLERYSLSGTPTPPRSPVIATGRRRARMKRRTWQPQLRGQPVPWPAGRPSPACGSSTGSA